MFELKVLTPDGWRERRDLRLRALADAPSAFGARLADWEGADEARWRQRLSVPGSYNVIAQWDGRPVGMASGMPTEEATVKTLIALWVAPEARGQAVGAALTADVACWASGQGARRLGLEVAAGNTRAIALYVRHGFVDIDVSRGADNRAMIRELGANAGGLHGV